MQIRQVLCYRVEVCRATRGAHTELCQRNVTKQNSEW
jgi:hypothetical protein